MRYRPPNTSKKKEFQVAPLLNAFNRQEVQEKLLLKYQTSKVQKMRDSVSITTKLNNMVILTLYGTVAVSRGRPTIIPQDDEGYWTGTVWGASV